jgi:hypothetical protein
MIELVPNNSERVRIHALSEDEETGVLQPATGLSFTVRVAESATSTAAIGTMSYTATELVGRLGDYIATIPGTDITSQLVSDYMNERVVIQVLEGTALQVYLDAIVRPVRRVP